jgi:hypothetical protein
MTLVAFAPQQRFSACAYLRAFRGRVDDFGAF